MNLDLRPIIPSSHQFSVHFSAGLHFKCYCFDNASTVQKYVFIDEFPEYQHDDKTQTRSTDPDPRTRLERLTKLYIHSEALSKVSKLVTPIIMEHETLRTPKQGFERSEQPS